MAHDSLDKNTWFQFLREISIQAGQEGEAVEFTVPMDKQLIIEFLSGVGGLPVNTFLQGSFQLISPKGNTTGIYFLTPSRQGNDGNQDLFVFSQSMRVHVDVGTRVLFTINRIGATTEAAEVTLTMTGQLLDADDDSNSTNF
jgi:hypothetical protein